MPRELHLIPGSVGEHAGKEGVHVSSIHGLAMLLDALSIRKDQALPQQSIALPEAVCDLPMAHTNTWGLDRVNEVETCSNQERTVPITRSLATLTKASYMRKSACEQDCAGAC